MARRRHMGSSEQSRHASHTVVIKIRIGECPTVNPVKKKHPVTHMCHRRRHTCLCSGQRSDSFLITVLAQSIHRLTDPQGPNP